MKTAKKSVAFFLVLAISYALFASSGSGLVVRSPLFGTSSTDEKPVDTLAIQGYSQQLGLSEVTMEETAEERVLTAISNGQYPVTPGDTYRLVYLDGLKTVTLDLQVDEKLAVAVPGLGTVEGAGFTFTQLKQQILAMVKTYHSYSNPQLVLTGTGSFTVAVIGEVGGTRFIPVWGLSRLSSVVSNATDFASTRAITITHKDNTSATYDLFLALRKGKLEQDPLLKSGDVVSIAKAQKMVVLAGNVYSPGTYQLEENQNLEDLLSYYGGGVLNSADVQKIRIQRYDRKTGIWQVIYANLLTGDISELQDQDQIVVDSIAPSMMSVTIEGAVSAAEVYDDLSSTALLGNSSGRIFYQFYPGESVKQLFDAIATRLMTVSDLNGVYLERDGQRIPLDLEQILYGNAENASMKLKASDIFTIPFNQRFVTVSGAVVRSGVYAYVPEKGLSYYLSLAGGLSDDASVPTSIKVYDANNKQIDRDSKIPSEATIKVARNTFVKDIAPTVAIVGLVSSILGIVYVVLQSITEAKSL
jgi:protein involved in polysaccharide export with SLBB domain